MNRQFTITIFSENHSGLLNRITIIFTRRKMNIESITTAKSEIPGIHRYNIVVEATQDQVEKVVGQIDKQVEVIRAYLSQDDEIIHREVALYKVLNRPGAREKLEKVVDSHGAKIIRDEKDYFAVELCSREGEIDILLKDLQPFGVCEFARSGRVAVTKAMDHMNDYLLALEDECSC
ncbi:acetolactate synthase small subunit [Fulvitalea axinellae]|uniref:Acetolactate synthase small subunit n=1 Tax=Fulvitalea axinellae TaxID=1182444 RepID=A0AAU9D5V3_9BACT|nr:acetolactate synthase small subunit [Fulvitalea axinellae]